MSEKKNEIILIENLTGNSLVNVTEFKKKIQDVKKANPIIEITDNASYEVAKKSRTAVKSVRVEIDNQDKAIGSAFAKVRKETIKINESLVEEIKPFELEHESNVKAWEDRKEKERQEKERIENERIEKIKEKVSEIETGCYEIIQKMQFSELSDTHKKVCEILNQEFDYEEFDILHSQAQNRVLAAFDDKQADLKQKEAQRVENERLERQNKRLEALYPVMAFTQGVEIMNLHALSEEEFNGILSKAKEDKAEADRKAHEEFDRQEKERKDREEKQASEKEAIFEVKKQRLFGLGLELDHMNCFSWVDIVHYIPVVDVLDSDTLEFEEIFNEAKEVLEKAKEEKALKERFENRVKIISEIGLKKDRIVESYFHDDVKVGITTYNLLKIDDDAFLEFVNVSKQNIYDAEKEREETRKASDKRQKALKADKGRVITYVASLEFRDAVPNFKNAESEQMLKEVEQRFSEFKEYIVEYVNKF